MDKFRVCAIHRAEPLYFDTKFAEDLDDLIDNNDVQASYGLHDAQ